MDEERRREVGLFRYALIRDAADAGLSKAERGRLVRALADREHVGPDGRLVRVARSTLDEWIRFYRRAGFEALVPRPRVVEPRTPAEVRQASFHICFTIRLHVGYLGGDRPADLRDRGALPTRAARALAGPTHAGRGQRGIVGGEPMREREVKLSVGADFRLPDLNDPGRAVSATARADERLSTVYFDSDDHRLAGWGLSLRYRDGQGWKLKLPDEGSGAVLERDEIVFQADPATPPPEAVDLVKAYLRHAELRPQVRLSTLRRRILLLDAQGALLADVVDDTVTVLDGEHASRRFRELEVETTDSTPRGLPKAVVARLRAAGAGPPDPTPQYLRAIGGRGAAPPEIILEKPRRSATLADVVTHAIADGVVRLLRHDPTIRLEADPEGVHQARVATRRLRSDLRTFRAALDPEWVGALRTELGWLGGELGQARDADVLFDRLNNRSARLSPDGREGARRVTGALARRRAQAHAHLRETLDSDRYLNLLDRLIAAAESPAFLGDKAGYATVEALPAVVRRAWRPLRKKVRALADPPADEDLHAVRILAKRCRYAAEACAPTLGKPTHKLAAAAKELQDVLGELNDAVVAERWLGDYAAHTRSGAGARAAGELAALERQAAHQARSHWPKAWKHVKAAAPAS